MASHPTPVRCAPVHGVLYTAFLERSAASPESVAVRAGQDSLTYGELETRSGVLARSLRDRGIGTGSIVGVCMPRTPDLLVSLLGVLRAGAAYLPLDPDDPLSRRAMIIEDAGAAKVITTRESVDEHPASLAFETALDDRADGPLPQVGSADLAYVIFTSGSTGRPKGVAVPHACVLAMFDAMGDEVSGGPGDVWLSVTSAAFDISVFEFFWTLGRGCTLELADIAGAKLFSTALAREGGDITHMQATPTLLSGLLLDPASRSGIGALRSLTCGGEALPPEQARELRSLVPNTLLNAYGPTEATVWASVEPIRAPFEEPVTIGRPLRGQEIHVLDPSGDPTADGEVGELYIGGSGVSWGYLGRPGLTASRFMADPFEDRPGARMYRTGDLGQRLLDGRIVCLGRNDRQVKIRGHRIELDEVEHTLLELDAVAAGTVILQGRPGDAQITAVVVAATGAGDAGAIRAALAAALPAASVPSAVSFVDQLPRTTTGKVDRRSLGDQTPSVEVPDGSYEVVVNEAGQHALWWAERARPEGWRGLGITGSVAHCGQEVDRLWPDIRPAAPN